MSNCVTSSPFPEVVISTCFLQNTHSPSLSPSVCCGTNLQFNLQQFNLCLRCKCSLSDNENAKQRGGSPERSHTHSLAHSNRVNTHTHTLVHESTANETQDRIELSVCKGHKTRVETARKQIGWEMSLFDCFKAL